MREILINQLKGLLKTGDIRKALEVMRSWLAIAEPGEPERLLAEVEDALRPKIALLMRDLLSRYPATIVGVPMLLLAAPDFEASGTSWSNSLKLPYPDRGAGQPCADLEFLGWMPVGSQLPLSLPFDPAAHRCEVPWLMPTAMVALFRSHPDLFDLDTIELPNLWWGSLFQSVTANVHLTARLLLPYPDALEAASLLQACARGEALPDKGNFLTDSAWSLACDEASLFQDTCRHLFPDVPG